MWQEIGVSTAIIGTSVVAAVVIAGGPSGIWVSDANDGAFTVDTSIAVFPPSALDGFEEPDTTTRKKPTDTTDASDVDTTDTTDVDPTDPAGTTPSATSSPVTSSAVTSPPATTEPIVAQSSVATDAVRERFELAVAVANGAGIGGLAGDWAAQLVELGYAAPAAVNSEPFPFTLVFAAPGFDEEGARLATDAGLPATAVIPMVDAPDLDTTVSFDVILMLGADQGSGGS